MDSNIINVVLRRLFLAVFAAIAYAVLGRLRQFWRLRHFKGPRTTGVSWWWHSRAVLSGEAQRWYGDVTEKYGESMRYVG